MTISKPVKAAVGSLERTHLSRALAGMKNGQRIDVSDYHDNVQRMALDWGRAKGVRIATRKQEGRVMSIWRIGKRTNATAKRGAKGEGKLSIYR